MNEDIMEIKDDEYLRNRFIERYKPFLAKYASGICHRYLRYGESEELSIALLAFNESIDRYNGEGIFFEYSKTVIKSRLYDYLNSRSYKESLGKASIDETENGDYYVGHLSVKSYQDELRNQYLKEEIEELKKVLNYYKIEFEELYDSRPKHILSKKHVNKTLSQILEHDDIVSYVIDKGKLPMNKIIEKCKTTKKKVEPYRQYMIAVIVICVGQFDLLKEYMPSEVIGK